MLTGHKTDKTCPIWQKRGFLGFVGFAGDSRLLYPG
jgi:hypothetical protein